MEGSHQVNWNSIIYRIGAIHKAEIEKSFFAAKRFNTNSVQFLSPYRDIAVSSLLIHVHDFLMCTGVLLKRFCVHEKLWFMKALMLGNMDVV